AGLGSLTPAELEEFTRLNSVYKDTFGFPFIICARLSTKGRIRSAFLERLEHSRDDEVRTALDEVSQICALRLHDMLADTGAM
ncbi:MAG: 2-oxo-4-hydroxy-4-carboxy-5-ureidoimidazoline decarboxylase, partial [Ktedonobacterales bacterium]